MKSSIAIGKISGVWIDHIFFDNIFNTDILSIFNIDSVSGADGWDRKELLIASWNSIKESPLGFILGQGAGHFYNTRPHNIFLATWLDFGLIFP